MKHKHLYGIICIVVSLPLLTALPSCDNGNEEPDTESSAVQGAHASWARSFDTLDELCNDSDINLIAIGTFKNIIEIENYSSIPEHPQYMTMFGFHVEKTLKGKCVKEIIVTQDGSPNIQGNGLKDDPLFNIGERYLLFLTKIKNYQDTYNHPGPWGRYQIIDGKTYSVNNTVEDSKVRAPGPGLDFNGIDISEITDTIKAIINTTLPE